MPGCLSGTYYVGDVFNCIAERGQVKYTIMEEYDNCIILNVNYTIMEEILNVNYTIMEEYDNCEVNYTIWKNMITV
jgi:hypothetical protein